MAADAPRPTSSPGRILPLHSVPSGAIEGAAGRTDGMDGMGGRLPLVISQRHSISPTGVPSRTGENERTNLRTTGEDAPDLPRGPVSRRVRSGRDGAGAVRVPHEPHLCGAEPLQPQEPRPAVRHRV